MMSKFEMSIGKGGKLATKFFLFNKGEKAEYLLSKPVKVGLR